jgi:hypothetical protein
MFKAASLLVNHYISKQMSVNSPKSETNLGAWSGQKGDHGQAPFSILKPLGNF